MSHSQEENALMKFLPSFFYFFFHFFFSAHPSQLRPLTSNEVTERRWNMILIVMIRASDPNFAFFTQRLPLWPQRSRKIFNMFFFFKNTSNQSIYYDDWNDDNLISLLSLELTGLSWVGWIRTMYAYSEKDTGRTMLYTAIENCVNNAKKRHRKRIQVHDYFEDYEGLLVFPNLS